MFRFIVSKRIVINSYKHKAELKFYTKCGQTLNKCITYLMLNEFEMKISNNIHIYKIYNIYIYTLRTRIHNTGNVSLLLVIVIVDGFFVVV